MSPTRTRREREPLEMVEFARRAIKAAGRHVEYADEPTPMRLKTWVMITLTRVGGELQWASDRMGHLTTDPACANHRPARVRSRLDLASRGLSCGECMARRAFGWDDPEPTGPDHTNGSRDA